MSTQTRGTAKHEIFRPNPVAKSKRAAVVGRHVAVITLIVVMLLPVWFIIVSALSGSDAILSTMAPPQWSLANFSLLFNSNDVYFAEWVMNSLKVGLTSSALNVLIGAFGAYAFSRLRFKGRRTTLLSLLMIQVFPSFLALSAVYAIVQQISRYAPAIGFGTPWALVLIYSGGALGINAWLIKGFFDTIPKELDESAMIDGATHWQTFSKVVLPLTLPALAVTFILSLIGSLNDFILASVILGSNSHNQTLAVGLYGFISSGFDSKWGAFTAGSVLASVPVVIVFIALQKYIIGGLTAGSVKG